MAELKSSQVLSLLRKELKQEINEQIDALYKLLTQGDSGSSEENGSNTINNICYKLTTNMDISIHEVTNISVDLLNLTPSNNIYQINEERTFDNDDNWYYLYTSSYTGDAHAWAGVLTKAFNPDISGGFIKDSSLQYELTDAENGTVKLKITGSVTVDPNATNNSIIYITWDNKPIYYIEKQQQIQNTYWHILDAELVDSESNSLLASASAGDIKIYNQKIEIIRFNLRPTENTVLKLKCIV